MSDPIKSNGFMGWLGRQVGHVRKALATDVAAPHAVVYRKTDVQQEPHPDEPGVTLRRTTVDEVIVATPQQPPQSSKD